MSKALLNAKIAKAKEAVAKGTLDAAGQRIVREAAEEMERQAELRGKYDEIQKTNPVVAARFALQNGIHDD